MKQTFLVEIECPAIEKHGLSPIISSVINLCLRHGIKTLMVPQLMDGLDTCVVEQSVERPILQDESEKPLRLSGNIAWDHELVSGDDYLEDRFNDLLDR